jgi:fucose permease
VTFDHTRRSAYVASVTQAIVNNLAPLLFVVFQTRYDVTLEMLGRLALLNFGTQVVAELVAVRFVDRMGFRRPLVVSHVLCAVGLVLLAVLPSVMPSPYLGLCVAIVVYAIGGGVLEVVVSPVVEGLPTPHHSKAAAMALLHSFYCWGQVAVVVTSTLLLAVVGQGGWRFLPLVWAVVPLVNAVAMARVPLPDTVAEHERLPLGDLARSPMFLAALCLMVCAGATEMTMSQWSSLFAEQSLGVDKVWGDLFGPGLFAVLMGSGRTVYGLWGRRMPLVPVMTASGVLAIGCYLTVALVANPAISLAACAVTGLAVSLLWPGTFSLAAARFPTGGAAMFGLLAVFGALGAAVGPWLAGALADATASTGSRLAELADRLPDDGGSGLRTGILVAVVFPVVVVVVTLALQRGRSPRPPAGPEVLSPMDAVGRSY